jgi:hypothetical protein
MRWREFIAGLKITAIWPLAARAQCRCASAITFLDTCLLEFGTHAEQIPGVGCDPSRNLFGSLSPTSRVDALGRLAPLLAPSIGNHLPDRCYTALTP